MLRPNPARFAVVTIAALSFGTQLSAQTGCCAAVDQSISIRYRVDAIHHRRFTHAELWRAIDPLLARGVVQSWRIGESVHLDTKFHARFEVSKILSRQLNPP